MAAAGFVPGRQLADSVDEANRRRGGSRQSGTAARLRACPTSGTPFRRFLGDGWCRRRRAWAPPGVLHLAIQLHLYCQSLLLFSVAVAGSIDATSGIKQGHPVSTLYY